MYAFIEGEVCEKLNGSLTLLAGGVGYLLSCSNNTLQAAPALGEKMRCYTFLSVREDAMELFGFAAREEKELFMQLTSVSGIGPKTALGLLGSMPLRDLNLAILLGDVNALSRAPGIGKKTAQRIALELKDKISQADISAHADEGIPAAASSVFANADSASEAVEAGNRKAAISTPLRKNYERSLQALGDAFDTPEDLIRLALRAMAGI